MSLFDSLRNSRMLRKPLLGLARLVLDQMQGGPRVLRRALYDAMPGPYAIASHAEHFVVSTKDKVIGREVFLYGEFDFHKLVTAFQVLRSEGHKTPCHLIDVGANIGTIAIPAINRGLVKSATAIEPHPDNLKLLHANIALNGMVDKVRVLPHAVGSQAGVSLMLEESADSSGNHSIGSMGIAVRSLRLDDIDFPEGCLLWMDIEGYEGHALTGGARLLAQGTPVVSEFNPTFLKRSGGLALFESALAGRRLYDLEMPAVGVVTLDKIAQRLRTKLDHDQWTDILALP
ncbi:FkbM family methyltransferase [Pseudoxanthomonas sp. J35]|uniref:FkbM family methyltransferase n=1 Tax=Pseudoxanthomonas sp. J35 TaxID=935852 RepID=UPI000A079D5B|nr:FkbM family methyltransferase [Pseudoxanthomonas sp. J35]